MVNFIIQIIYFVFFVYIAMAAFISLRDIITTEHKFLWISIIGIGLGLIVLLLFTKQMSALALPITIIISLPIFLTDKRRNWDALDRMFRWVSMAAVLCALFLFLNYYFLR